MNIKIRKDSNGWYAVVTNGENKRTVRLGAPCLLELGAVLGSELDEGDCLVDLPDLLAN